MKKFAIIKKTTTVISKNIGEVLMPRLEERYVTITFLGIPIYKSYIKVR